MNIIEETPGTFWLEISGLSIREIKDIFEERWGSSLMWSNCSAYPTDTVKLQFVSRDRIAELERQLAELRSQPTAQQVEDARRYQYLRRKFCLTGNGDGTCAMQAINLPGAISGWPEPSQVAEFCDVAIDAAMQAGKGPE